MMESPHKERSLLHVTSEPLITELVQETPIVSNEVSRIDASSPTHM